MPKKTNRKRLRPKAPVDLSRCFLTSDEDDSDASEEIIPSSQSRKRIFQNAPRQKPRASLIARNLNEFASSLSLQPVRKALNSQQSTVSSEDDCNNNDEQQNQEEIFPSSPRKKRIFQNAPRKKPRASLIARNLNEFVSSTPMHPTRKVFNSLRLSPIENESPEKQRRNSKSLQLETSKSSGKKIVAENLSEVLARPLPLTSSESQCDNNERQQNQPEHNENHAITRMETRKTICAHAQTSFTSPLYRILQSYHNVLIQTAADKGTQITDSLEQPIIPKRNLSRKRGTIHKDDSKEEDENDVTLTKENLGKNQHTPDHMEGQTDRRNVLNGARADADGARADADLPTGTRADSPANNSKGSASTDATDSDIRSWSKDDRKKKWLSALLDGYFESSRRSAVAGSQEENHAEIIQNQPCVQLRSEDRVLREDANNTANSNPGISNVQNDNGSYSGNVSSYDSHADRTRKTNNNTNNKGKRSDCDDLSQMEIIENDILTPKMVEKDKSISRKSEKTPTGVMKNRKSKKSEGEAGASRNVNEINKENDLQDAVEPVADELNQSTPNRSRPAESRSIRKSKLEAFLLGSASISPTKINKSLQRDQQKNKEEHITETTKALTAPEERSEPVQAPKINVIENRLLNAVDSNTNESKENNSKQTKTRTTKKPQKKSKDVIPAIIVSENTDEDSQDGVRRSGRRRKERTILYKPEIIYTNRREFLRFTKGNIALQSVETVDEPSKLYLSESSNRGKRTSRKDKSLKSVMKSPKDKSKRPKKKQKREQVMDTIDEDENNVNLEQNQVPISDSLSKGNPVEFSTLGVNVTGTTGKFDSSHFANSAHLRSTFQYFSSPRNERSKNENSYFPMPRFHASDANENLRISVNTQSSRDGFESGWLEILPGRSKPRDTSVKFSLLFTVLEGRGLFRVGDSSEVLKQFRECHVPSGTYYSIENQYKTKSLHLYYVKIKPQCK